MSYYRETLENYLKTLDIKADRVLDVGGASNPVKDRVNSWAVDDYRIVDNGLEYSEFVYYDCDLNKEKYHPKKYSEADIVFCLEVMEYIYDPVMAMRNLADFTKDGGTLYITFPTLYPVHNPYNNDYLRYTKFGAIKLLEEGQFKIQEIVPRVMKDPKLYDKHVKTEGYKARGATSSGTLFDAGYIFKATKI